MIDVEALVTQKDCGGMPLYRCVLKEVNTRMEEWEDKMKVVEQLVHTEFLLREADKEGVNIGGISDDPLSIYMSKKRKSSEVGVMVQFDCPFCTSFIEDIEVS